MTTALDVLKRSMRLLGVFSTGEEPSAQETADGLTALNALIGTLSNTSLVYAKTLDSISVAAGTASITVGPSGGTITPRPVRVLEDSYFVIGAESYPLQLLTLKQYNSIGDKTSEGAPDGIHVQPDMPNITITFYPVPSEAITLKLWSDKLIASTLSAATVLSLPPGYEDAFAYLLAESIAPEYQVEPSQAVMRGVMRSRRLLARTNLQISPLSMPAALCGSGGDIFSGQ
jgi:hypothetical protein